MSAASFLPKASPMDIDNEDSLDAPPSVGSNDATPSTPAQKKVCRSSTYIHIFLSSLSNPATNFKVKGQQKKPVTPYILYSSEIRRTIAEQNKTSSFGEISRIVGEKVSHQALRSKLICSFLPVPFSLSCSTAFSLFAATPPAYSSTNPGLRCLL